LENPTFSGMKITEIIKAAGGPTKLARGLGLHHTTVLGWRHVPAERAAEVSRITGIPRHELRPDLWEAPTSQADAAA
jgi:DNA-binding transcriptional regulator YdaS (Cro superfamily)